MAEFRAVDEAVNSLRSVDEYIQVGMDMCMEVANDFINNHQGEAKENMENFQKIMLELVSMDEDVEHLKKAVQHVKQHDGGGEEDMVGTLETKLIQMKSDEQTLLQKDKMKDFKRKIQSALHSEEEGVVGASGLSDDVDLEMTEEVINTRCPYTGLIMKKPVKNTHCGHTYDKDGILLHIKQRKHNAKCPISGCSNEKPITADDLVDNKEMRRYIEKINRK